MEYRLLNSLVYGHVPQSRPRVYIVGLSHMQRDFNWPAAHEPVGLRSVLEASPHPSDGPANATELYNLRASLQSLRQNGFPEAVVDLAVGWQAGPSITYGHCPPTAIGCCT